MPTAKRIGLGFNETLGATILPSRCIGCGSCVATCPASCIEYIDGKPSLRGECRSCGICSKICPRYELPLSTLEELALGRKRGPNEPFGVYRSLWVARSMDDRILRVCQDGGVVTSLLNFALKKGIIDGAALSGVDENEPLRAVPRLALTENNLVQCAGTRYNYSPNILAFGEGLERGKERLAFVGTPCQIQAIRRIQHLPLRRFSDHLSLTIGLFCSACFTYDGLVKDFISGKMGIDPSSIKKLNIKGQLIITMKSGDVKTVPLKEIRKYTARCVEGCSDFSAELADVSVGGLGLEDWTMTILRTEFGERVFMEAKANGIIEAKPLDEVDGKILDLLIRMSVRKREASVLTRA